jgi:hypothetical protein
MQPPSSAHVDHPTISHTHTHLTKSTTVTTDDATLLEQFVNLTHDQVVGGAVRSDDGEGDTEISEAYTDKGQRATPWIPHLHPCCLVNHLIVNSTLV